MYIFFFFRINPRQLSFQSAEEVRKYSITVCIQYCIFIMSPLGHAYIIIYKKTQSDAPAYKQRDTYFTVMYTVQKQAVSPVGNFSPAMGAIGTK